MCAFAFAPVCANLKSRFLSGLVPSEVNMVVDAAKQRHFLAKSVVVNQGDAADHLFLITQGRARFFFNTVDGTKVILFWLTPGEIFGGSAVLSIPSTYLVSAETVTESLMLVWDRPALRRLTLRYPRLLDNASLISYSYLDWYVADHQALISHTARQRLGRVLVSLAKSIGDKVPDGFEFDATNEELAEAANITRFTASRLLKEWQTNRAITKRRGKIVVRAPECLFLKQSET